MTSGSTYVIAAFASNNGTVTATPTVPGSTPTITLAATNTYSTQNNCNDSTDCYEWVWSFERDLDFDDGNGIDRIHRHTDW